MHNSDNIQTSSAIRNSPSLKECPQDGVVKNRISNNHYLINGTIIYHKPKLNLPFNVNLKDRAKTLRYAENLPEVLFWMQVTKGHFHKIDFDRQRIIGNYIVDFYAKQLGLIIEIDGSSHDDKELYDKKREEYFISLGLKVYRISVDDVMKKMNFVLMGLENYIIENYGVSSG